MHFTHYQITAGKVFAVNPHHCTDGTYVSCINLPDGPNCDECNKAIRFNNWQSTQPEITADPSIKDGVYKVDEFEIVWQFKTKQESEWTTEIHPDAYKGTYDYYEYCTKMISNDYETRQYATLKQPVKQEEKEVKIYTLTQCREIVLLALNRAAHQTESPTIHHRIISIDIDDLFNIFD